MHAKQARLIEWRSWSIVEHHGAEMKSDATGSKRVFPRWAKRRFCIDFLLLRRRLMAVEAKNFRQVKMLTPCHLPGQSFLPTSRETISLDGLSLKSSMSAGLFHSRWWDGDGYNVVIQFSETRKEFFKVVQIDLQQVHYVRHMFQFHDYVFVSMSDCFTKPFSFSITSCIYTQSHLKILLSHI